MATRFEPRVSIAISRDAKCAFFVTRESLQAKEKRKQKTRSLKRMLRFGSLLEMTTLREAGGKRRKLFERNISFDHPRGARMPLGVVG